MPPWISLKNHATSCVLNMVSRSTLPPKCPPKTPIRFQGGRINQSYPPSAHQQQLGFEDNRAFNSGPKFAAKKATGLPQRRKRRKRSFVLLASGLRFLFIPRNLWPRACASAKQTNLKDGHKRSLDSVPAPLRPWAPDTGHLRNARLPYWPARARPSPACGMWTTLRRGS
jgi:hypothetical protein